MTDLGAIFGVRVQVGDREFDHLPIAGSRIDGADAGAIPAIIDFFHLRRNIMYSIKQSPTVPLHVGYQYLPTQSVISTLKKVKELS